ncbi:MAG: TVP38/TMEM64 family protein [Candidatus Lokiarchaeota archaeon]|nr:TVP38/TMEM64 family protein [Candidatus Lokiarchaeota archaeon]
MDESETFSQKSEKRTFFQRLWNGIKKISLQLWEMIKRSFREHSKTTWIWIGIFISVLVITVFLWIVQFYNPDLLFRLIINYIVKPIYEIRFWGHLIFFLVMGIQAILLPIPSEAILLSGGMIWGWWGILDGIIGSIFAGVITYYMVLKGGRPLAEKFAGKEAIDILDRFINKYGAWAIFILRALPFMAFDPVSFAAGLTKIKTRTYLLATFLGSVIRVLFFVFLGEVLFLPDGDIGYYIEHPLEMEYAIQVGARPFNIMSISIVLIGVTFLALYQFVLMPYLQKKGEKKKSNSVVKPVGTLKVNGKGKEEEHKSGLSETR